jgi:hypothetical protein
MSEQLELFPTEVGYELSPQEEIKNNSDNIVVTKKYYDDCEWCFQFNDGEPTIFAFTNPPQSKNELTFTIDNSDQSAMIFTNKDGQFKIFAREITEETKLKREEIYASKNKEA